MKRFCRFLARLLRRQAERLDPPAGPVWAEVSVYKRTGTHVLEISSPTGSLLFTREGAVDLRQAIREVLEEDSLSILRN